MILPIGPIHPGLKEPLRLKLKTEGERVIDAEIDYGYVHRGIEKIMEGKTWQKAIYLAERVCGICSYEHTQTFAETIEKICGVQAPLRAQYLRVITNELDRVQSHLLANSTFFKTMDHETLYMDVLRMTDRHERNSRHQLQTIRLQNSSLPYPTFPILSLPLCHKYV